MNHDEHKNRSVTNQEESEQLDEQLEVDPMAEYEADPMAEFESVESSLNWPDRKQKQDNEEGGTDTDNLPDDPLSENESAAHTPTESAASISDDGIDQVEQEALIESIEQGATSEELADSSDLFIDDTELTLEESELLLSDAEAPRKKRGLFGRKEKAPKKKKRGKKSKREQSVNLANETESVNYIDEPQEQDVTHNDSHNDYPIDEQEALTQEYQDYGHAPYEQHFLEDENPRRGFNPVRVVVGVGKMMLFTALVAGVSYLYLEVRSLKQSEGQSAFNVREHMLSEMESLESRVLETATGIKSEFKTTVTQVEQIKATVALNEMRLKEALEGSDGELAIDAIKEMIDVDRSVISKLDASIESLEKKIAELDKKAPAAKASKATPARKATPRRPAPRTVRSVAGYSMFSVDVWGDTPLLVLIKGDEIKRLKKGESIAGWQVTSIDSYQKKATLQKGNVTSYLQG